MKSPLLQRALAILAVALLLLVPLALVNGKVAERQARALGVQKAFANETSGAQVLAGPLLALTCEETYIDERQVMRAGKAETVAERRTRTCPTAYFPPRTLEISGRVPVEERRRGIYPIRLYRAALDVAAEFAWPEPAAPVGDKQRVWKQAYLVLAVSDSRGMKSIVARGAALAFGGGAHGIEARFGLQAPLGEYADRRGGEALAVSLALELQGTTSLTIAPVGDATRVRLASDWPHPSFTGAWLPDERRIASTGFEATWKISHHATGGRPAWQKLAREGGFAGSTAVSGVALVEPVNVYALAHRATEYGFLFVLFTFAGLALVEAMAGVRLHPVQYALVGSALAVFFLLLVALAEHLAFGAAYLAASAACAALLTFYLRHPLRSMRRTAAFLALFATLYGALYGLLLSEDHALLLGSLLVFSALAAVMALTRSVDWAGFTASPRSA